jgi:signal transduction histidine kinase
MGNEKYKEFVDDIHDGSGHLLTIINDVLDFTKIESGITHLQESEIDVSRLFNRVVRLVSPLADQGRVKIDSQIDPDLPAVMADETKLKQVLINLLSNAIKFTPEGGEVCFRAEQTEAGDIHFAVVDNGIGIDENDLPKVFDAFVQVEDSLDRRYEGTGLGVPIALALTELHDGSLNIESALGVGTTVNVILPRSRVVSSRLLEPAAAVK